MTVGDDRERGFCDRLTHLVACFRYRNRNARNDDKRHDNHDDRHGNSDDKQEHVGSIEGNGVRFGMCGSLLGQQ